VGSFLGEAHDKRWELFSERRNPIALVRVKDGSRRWQRPAILSVDQFENHHCLIEIAVPHDGISPNASVFRGNGAQADESERLKA
jgi:hypothetical protein